MNITDFSNTYCDIAVVGGGASGLVAAIVASGNGKRVCIFESGERVGKKILATGNGKCNLSHKGITKDNYYGSGTGRVSSFLEIFGTEETVHFFEECGLLIRDRDGYIYPYSETAQSVLDSLRYKLSQTKAEIVSECRITGIEKNKDGFVLFSDKGKKYNSSKVIMCTGGKASPKTGSDGSGIKLSESLGLRIVKTRPALCKVISDEDYCKSVDGVRAKGKAALYIGEECIYSEQGEIQFTKDGLSGIPVFNMSRLVSYAISDKKSVSVRLDLVPEMNMSDLLHFYKTKATASLSAEEFLAGILNKKITALAMKCCHIKPNSEAEYLSESDIGSFCELIKNLKFNITGVYGFDNAQVTAGGVHFDEINDRLESFKYPGLFFAGEILDIDGICGGYNLQWAWTSGYIAGKAAAE